MSRIIPAAMIGAMALTACGAEAQQATGAQAEPARVLNVTGQGEAVGTPDMAMMSFGVTATGKSAADALAANATAMTKVRDELRKLGIAARDMQTSNFSLSPEYSRDDRGRYDRTKIVGYTVNNALNVRLRDIDKVGDTIDAAVTAGANNLNGLSFGFQDSDDLTEQAQRNAVKDARATAELLADEAGVSLGRVMSISMQSYRQSPQPMAMMRAEMVSADATPIEAGESLMSVSVNMTFELK